jgi:hypothetical protein
MVPYARLAAATIATIVCVTFAATVSAHAAQSAAICKSLSVSGAGRIQWSVIGNVSCQEAKPWLVKILGKHGAPGAPAKIAPPKGFHCRATNNKKGIPSVGACYTGTIQFPKNGFQWFG